MKVATAFTICMIFILICAIIIFYVGAWSLDIIRHGVLSLETVNAVFVFVFVFIFAVFWLLIAIMIVLAFAEDR